MIRPWQALSWLALLALVATAWVWQARSGDWQPPAPLPPELPDIATLPQAEQAAMAQSLARPVLWAARRPVASGADKGEAKSELEQARLMAVVAAGKDEIALLSAPSGKTLKITAATRPWRLESFDGRTAVFTSAADGKRIERSLEQVSPAPPAPGAPAAAARAKR